MANEKNVFNQLDDLSAGQAEILSEVIGVRNKITSNESTINELKEKVARLEAQSRPVAHKKSDKELLQDFLRSSKKSWRWFGSSRDFKKAKQRLYALLYSLLALGIISTIVSSISFGLYSTFTLFENIWLIFVIISFSNIYLVPLKCDIDNLK